MFELDQPDEEVKKKKQRVLVGLFVLLLTGTVALLGTALSFPLPPVPPQTGARFTATPAPTDTPPPSAPASPTATRAASPTPPQPTVEISATPTATATPGGAGGAPEVSPTPTDTPTPTGGVQLPVTGSGRRPESYWLALGIAAWALGAAMLAGARALRRAG